jgi:hypothetical protein
LIQITWQFLNTLSKCSWKPRWSSSSYNRSDLL